MCVCVCEQDNKIYARCTSCTLAVSDTPGGGSNSGTSSSGSTGKRKKNDKDAVDFQVLGRGKLYWIVMEESEYASAMMPKSKHGPTTK